MRIIYTITLLTLAACGTCFDPCNTYQQQPTYQQPYPQQQYPQQQQPGYGYPYGR